MNEALLHVGNLPYSIERDDLEAMFLNAGTVASASLMTYKFDSRSSGYGFVEMASPEEARKAVEMYNGREVRERKLAVNLARPRTSSFDAAFGLDRKKSQEIDWLGDPFELPKIRPVSTFDDTLDWWYAGDEHGTDSHPGRYQQGWSSVDVPKTGTTITVKKVKKNGVMVIKVGTSS